MTAMAANGATTKVATALAAVGELAECSLAGCSDDELLDVVRSIEKLRRSVESLDNVVIPELESRGLPGRFVVRGTKQLLGGLLNLSPFEAGARVRAAQALGPRPQLTGQVLAPLLPLAAEARASGAITGKQAEVIIRCVGKLRAAEQVTVDEVAEAEAFLVEQASTFDAHTLNGIAQRVLDTLDPDGALDDDTRQQRRRFLSLLPSGDNMWRLTADLDADTAAMAMTALHSLAAPKSGRSDDSGEEAGHRDERTSPQRLHDALTAVFKIALRSGQLPRSGGIPATVLISMTAEQFETRTGLATTSFGQRMSVDHALRLADEASVAWIVHSSRGGILNYGISKRCATEAQTLALISRDRGCAFPGCTDPPEWTERHHVTPWSHGGPTDIDNLCLLCDFHHDRIDTGGWTVQVKDGVPWFIPPAWIDSTQAPRRNQRP